jgi:putative protease
LFSKGMIKRKPELLAPAGDAQALRAAVENGADAVYFGGKMFGARAYAGNFDRQEIKAALEYAHTRDVRVYITVNTLVDNREFGELTDYLFFLYREGVDALIIQDIGVAGLIKELLPDFPLHGSTQMTVHNAAGCSFLENLGVERAILAREVGLAELMSICQNSPLDLEVFVHGAICFCYSGQCLLSSMIGGRSGNRGRCAQPCRLPYHLVDEKEQEVRGIPGKYPLSPKDLMLLREIPDLIKAGVTSLKIEGRMKSAEYVATVVRIYREALDSAWDDPQNYMVSSQDVQDLALVFNRGFTTGYFHGDPGRELIGYTKPNNRGLFLGRVEKVVKNRISIMTRLPLKVGDEIEFWTGDGHSSLTLEKIYVRGRSTEQVPSGSELEISVPFHVKKGDRVFKTHDQQLVELARESISGVSRRRVPLNVRVVAHLGEPLLLEGRDEDGFHAIAQGEFLGERARKHELTADLLDEQIGRLGNTPFTLHDLECDIEAGVIFPISEINAVRRQLTVALEKARLYPFQRSLSNDLEGREKAYWTKLREGVKRCKERPKEKKVIKRSQVSLAVAVGDNEGLRAAIAGGADIIYFGGYSIRGRTAWNEERIRSGVDSCLKHGVEPYLIIPPIWQESQEATVMKVLEQARGFAVDGVLAGDLGGCYLSLQDDLDVVTDFSVPVFNDSAVNTLLEVGVSRLTVSPELNRQQLEKLYFKNKGVLELIVHGALPLMISEHCVLGVAGGGKGKCGAGCSRTHFLKDRRGYLFPLVSDESCRMTLYNSRELCLIEYLDQIIGTGYDILRLELRPYSADHVHRITGIYRKACDAVQEGHWGSGMMRDIWEELSEQSLAGLTRGHYLRGVL